MEYASNAKGNLGVALGAIGTSLGALSGTGLLSGFNGVNCMNGRNCGDYVNRYELNMVQTIANKDSEIALLKAESDSEEKMIEVYKQAHAEIAELRKDFETSRREQDAWNANQSVANTHMTAAIATNTNSIRDLEYVVRNITAIRVPNTAVCPGWGDVKVEPVTP